MLLLNAEVFVFVDLPIADSIKVLGVTLDRRLTLDNHVSPWRDRATTMHELSATYAIY